MTKLEYENRVFLNVSSIASPVPEMLIDGQPISLTPSSGDEGVKSLHQLARDGDIEGIKMWLSKNVGSINELDEKKLAPLHYAARYSNINGVSHLSQNYTFFMKVDALAQGKILKHHF